MVWEEIIYMRLPTFLMERFLLTTTQNGYHSIFYCQYIFRQTIQILKIMSVNVYSVIWADDECITLEKDKSIRQLLDVKHIEVLAYVQTSEELKDKIETYKDRVDAIIIDGNFSKSHVAYLEPKDISGLIHTVSFIELFNNKRDIPFFLYTARKVMLQELCNNGEIDYFKNNNRLIQKGDIELLANQIVHDVDHIHSVEFMVKKKYKCLLDIAQKVSPQC